MFNFALALKVAKARLGLTNQDIANELGVATSAVYAWTAGKNMPNAEKIIIFLNNHNVTLEQFNSWGEK